MFALACSSRCVSAVLHRWRVLTFPPPRSTPSASHWAWPCISHPHWGGCISRASQKPEDEYGAGQQSIMTVLIAIGFRRSLWCFLSVCPVARGSCTGSKIICEGTDAFRVAPAISSLFILAVVPCLHGLPLLMAVSLPRPVEIHFVQYGIGEYHQI